MSFHLGAAWQQMEMQETANLEFSQLFELPAEGDAAKHEQFRQHFLENVRNGRL